MRTITPEELKDILDKHGKWLRNEEGGERAIMSGAIMTGVNMRDAIMSGAIMTGSDMRDADMRGSDMRGSDMTGSDMTGVNMRYANMRGADMTGVNMRYANMRDAIMSDAIMSGAIMRDAIMSGAIMSGAIMRGATGISPIVDAMTRICPEGSIIGWKKAIAKTKSGFALVKLRIPEDARRSNATGRKCRAEWAEVIEVVGADEAWSDHEPKTYYRKGEMVRPDKWDENRWEECSNGIHFFITEAEAEAYDL